MKQTNSWQLGIHKKSIKKLKRRIKGITKRNRGISIKQYMRELEQYMRGWLSYFYHGAALNLLEKIDGYTRQRLRVILWKHWKSSKMRIKMQRKYGSKNVRYTNSRRGPVRVARGLNSRILRNIIMEREFGYRSLVRMFINLMEKKSKSDMQCQLMLFEL